MYRLFSSNIRLLVWLSRVSLIDPKALSAHECGRLGGFIPRFSVCHEEAEKKLVSCRDSWEKDVLGSYHGSLAYGNLAKKSQRTKKCCKKHKGYRDEVVLYVFAGAERCCY